MFAKPPFGFHRGEITLTTSRLKKRKGAKERQTIAIKIQRAPFACRENSTSSCSKPFPVSSKTRRGNGMARDFSERRIG